jgi:hypothetical protein
MEDIIVSHISNIMLVSMTLYLVFMYGSCMRGGVK